jgi:16S rRNA processing protein RimM
LKLAGVDTPEAAARLRDQTVLVEIADVVPLKKGQYYQYQLIGLKVITEAGEALGELTEILETGANDVYVVTGAEGREILLPATDEVIRAIEVERGEMVVRRLEGL